MKRTNRGAVVVIGPAVLFVVRDGVRLRPTLDEPFPIAQIGKVPRRVVGLRQLVERRQIMDLERIRVAVCCRYTGMPVERVDVFDREAKRRGRHIPVTAQRPVRILNRPCVAELLIFIRNMRAGRLHVVVGEGARVRLLEARCGQRPRDKQFRLALFQIYFLIVLDGLEIPSGRSDDVVAFRPG